MATPKKDFMLQIIAAYDPRLGVVRDRFLVRREPALRSSKISTMT
jgi:hypothetical protein